MYLFIRSFDIFNLYLVRSHTGVHAPFLEVPAISTSKMEKETPRTLWQANALAFQVHPRTNLYESAIWDGSLFLNNLESKWKDNFKWYKRPSSAIKAPPSFTRTGNSYTTTGMIMFILELITIVLCIQQNRSQEGKRLYNQGSSTSLLFLTK